MTKQPATTAGLGVRSAQQGVPSVTPHAHELARADTTLEKLPTAPMLPLSYQQEAVIEQYSRFPECEKFHKQFAVFELKGDLNVAVLCQALESVEARHDGLRFRLQRSGTRCYAAFDGDKMSVEEEDLRDKTEDQALAYVTEQAEAPYSITRGGLCRAKLYRLSANTHWLMIAAHHIVFDYWSMGVIVEDIGTAYLQALAGRQVLTGSPAWTPTAYSLWQRSEEFASIVAQQRPFWRELLRKSTSRSELLFYPPPDTPIYNFDDDFAKVRISLDADLVNSLKAFSREQNLTFYMTLLAVFILTLRYFGAEERVMVVVPVSRRTRSELAKMVALLYGPMPLVFETGGLREVRHFLGDTHQIVTGALANQDVQFQEFAQLATCELHHQFMFNLQNSPVPEFELPNMRVRPLCVDYGIHWLDISLCLTQSAVLSGDNAGISGYLMINKNLISEAEAARLWEVYLAIGGRIVTGVEQTINSLLEGVRNASP